MNTLLCIIPLFVLVGCASEPTPQVEAVSETKPVIVALRAYHRTFGDYPEKLDQLGPLFVGADNLIYNNRDVRHSWSLGYQRVDRDNYTLYLDSTPCSQAVFKDGTFVAGSGPNFK